MKCTILLSVCIGVLGMQLTAAAAKEMPEFNITAICRAGSGAVQTFETCIKEEQAAHDQLAKLWAQFAPSDESSCVRETRIGGSPSYVELLTCLQMAKDVKALPPDPLGPLPVIEKEKNR